ncbi:unnamed protein product [Adineta steineri]|uniref:Uncharacterized protein n=1 Tax=Adineta steineri TaxID=433720 RepID=A0A815R920_9BILA|nr:unnamed protein product [Adineta steineri]CAF1474260.1 unnamed protein product [Adineta steineri]
MTAVGMPVVNDNESETGSNGQGQLDPMSSFGGFVLLFETEHEASVQAASPMPRSMVLDAVLHKISRIVWNRPFPGRTVRPGYENEC